MNIIVCIKQVPDTTSIEIDEKTGSLKREGVESKVNVYDLHALEAALKIKEQVGGKITVLTMGPLQAAQSIREALMLGADDGYLISDRCFAGSDVLATSYTLAQAVRTLGKFDLIICGKQTTDGDTAQVGPALAEQLGIPHATWVNEILEVDSNGLLFEQDLMESVLRVRAEYPLLITVEKRRSEPRLPSFLLKQKLACRGVKTLSLANFSDRDIDRYGVDGSATHVEKIFPPEENTEHVMLKGNPELLVEDILQILKKGKFI